MVSSYAKLLKKRFCQLKVFNFKKKYKKIDKENKLPSHKKNC